MKIPRRTFLKQSSGALAVVPLQIPAARSAETAPVPKFVDVDGIRTRYFEKGSGEPLVLVHGGNIASNATAMRGAIFDLLAQHFRVYALDRLGNGETDNPKRDEDYNMRAVSQHLYNFLRKLGIQRAHLAGMSRGALPVAWIAVNHPEITKTLIISNSNTLGPDDQGTPVDWYDRFPAKPATPKIAEAAARMELLGSRWAEQNRELRHLAKIDGPSPWWLRDHKFETLDLIRAGRLRVPTLIVWGFHDPSVSFMTNYQLLNLIVPSPEVVHPTRVQGICYR